MNRNRHKAHKKLKDAWYLEHCDVCYIQDKNGTPLYPTQRIERMLRKVNTGKAHVINDYPLTIRLNYDAPENYMEHKIHLGIDPGRENLGYTAIDAVTGDVLFKAHVATNNKEVANHMQERAVHRHDSRRGERKVRQRQAKRNETTTNKYDRTGRMLPGYEKPIYPKDIKNSQARFMNRKHNIDGWLTPSAMTLARTQISMLDSVCHILSIEHVSYEYNAFDTQLMYAKENGIPYRPQNGPLYGYKNAKKLVYMRQDGKCLFCEHDIEHYHHVRPRSNGGANTQRNLIGVCHECHEKIHKGLLTPDIDGCGKRYACVSVQQQAFTLVWKEIKRRFKSEASLVDPYYVKRYRETYGIMKDHPEDAACIAAVGAGGIELNGLDYAHRFEVRRYRRHNRSLIASQRERSYVDIGRQLLSSEKKPHKPIAAKNRHARTGQDIMKTPSLEEFRVLNGNIAISRLIVLPSERRYYSNMHRPLPGSVIIYGGKRYILSYSCSGGREYSLIDIHGNKRRVPVRKCKIHEQNKGLTYVQ